MPSEDLPERIYTSELHQLVPLAQVQKYERQKGNIGHRALLPCRVCKHLHGKRNLASCYCRQCSKPNVGVFMPLCGPQSMRGTLCYQRHTHTTCKSMVTLFQRWRAHISLTFLHISQFLLGRSVFFLCFLLVFFSANQ